MFTNNYKPYMGGVPISVDHLAIALRELGHEVYIFAPTYKEQEEEEYVIRYPSFPIAVAGAPIPNVLTNLFDRKIKELSIDVIHVHHPVLVGNVALHLRKKYGIPVIFTYHTRYEEYLHYVKTLAWLERSTGFLEKYLVWFSNQCDGIVAPTAGIKKYLERRKIESCITILPTGIPIESFTPNQEMVAKIKERYGKNVDYLLCTVSRMAKEKNIEFQLRGLARLKETLQKQQKTFRYLIIGDGPQLQEFKKLAIRIGLEKEVVFLGRIENTQVSAYLKACDLFAFSSKSETQGIVLLEAMAVGKPIVAVKASGVEDIVEDDITGFMTREDEEVWKDKVLTILENSCKRERMGKAAQNMAFEYEERRIALAAVECYRRVIKRKVFYQGKRSWLHDYSVS